MIVRELLKREISLAAPGARPVWLAFLDTQKLPLPPYALILQADHAKLAGELAASLCPDVFGNLPGDVLEAIRLHDVGWEGNDQTQLNTMPQKVAKPFSLLPPDESLPCWNESIRRAETRSRVQGVITSRHFCALAQDSPAHRQFSEVETRRREEVEKSLNLAPEDLARWTSAIGFCDILSLYLCCGTPEAVELPLAHPALPESRNARKVFLDWAQDVPMFSSPIVVSGSRVSVEGWQEADGAGDLQRINFSWLFAGDGGAEAAALKIRF